MAYDGEFDEVILTTGQTRPVMSRPPEMQAASKFVIEVRDALGLSDESAPAAADWVLNKMERYAASQARPVFDTEGNGPQCSWCGQIWPLCGHHHMSAVRYPEDDETPRDRMVADNGAATATVNPDCSAGKHKACSGTAWDDAADALTTCTCSCHGGA